MADHDIRWVELQCGCDRWNVDEYWMTWEDLKRRVDEHLAICPGPEDDHA